MTATAHNDPPQRMVKPRDDQKRQAAPGRSTDKKSRKEHGGVGEGRNGERSNKDGALVTMRCWSPARVALLLVSMRPRCGRLRRGESVGFGTSPESALSSGLQEEGGKLMRSGFQCCADTGGACLRKRAGGEQELVEASAVVAARRIAGTLAAQANERRRQNGGHGTAHLLALYVSQRQGFVQGGVAADARAAVGMGVDRGFERGRATTAKKRQMLAEHQTRSKSWKPSFRPRTPFAS
ncbi:hypothetical protein CCMA1212_008836 [Trichoderma ghanense]|uniref:Uncharacterized protein n=1 Tax=Trichoderma ghanense TaxID=65468 RepID=A0ABY2GU69_9HYPO